MGLRNSIIGIALLLITASSVCGQSTFSSVESEVNFIAGKNIEASNSKSKFVIRSSDKAIVGLINIKDFIFPNSLMQEHFNENYMDSDKYPTASFSGILLGFDESRIEENKKEFIAEGNLKIHGIERKVKLPVVIFKEKEKIRLTSSFSVLLKDYKVKIPKVVFVKLAEEVQIEIKATLE